MADFFCWKRPQQPLVYYFADQPIATHPAIKPLTEIAGKKMNKPVIFGHV